MQVTRVTLSSRDILFRCLCFRSGFLPIFHTTYRRKEKRGKKGGRGGETKYFNGQYSDCFGFFNEMPIIFLREFLNGISI